MPLWHRLAVFGGVLLFTALVARLVDRAMTRKELDPAAVTRYRVLRRSILTAIVFVGVFSALLVIPQVRAVATGILASSAVVGIVVGFAAQRTLGNFVAGLLIAFSQPIRLGDWIEFEGLAGEVEEIGLTYTFIRTAEDDRLEIGQNSFVYAANGALLGSIPAERNRTPVRLGRISPWTLKATVAIEDHRFYTHGGVDYEGIIRAAWKDLRAGEVVQGGSTITQQLVRNLYISKERTLARKLKEACLAIKLSRARSKDWILEQYMNQVYYGNHAYGIEAAAQTYFSKHARDLTLRQAALLAGLPQAPSTYDPLHRPVAALARRNTVLRAMARYGDITAARYRHAVSSRRLGLRPGKLYTRIREPYFFSYVRDQLIAEYGSSTVRSGGLRVYTTINPRLQLVAAKAIRDTLYLRDDPAAAIVSIDPADGAIRAMTAVTP